MVGAAAAALVVGLGAGAASALGAAPAATLTGTLLAGGALTGEAGVFVQGAAPSVQIDSVTITVDGIDRESSSGGPLWLDTATLADGTHLVAITATDGVTDDSGQVWSGFIRHS